MLNFCLQRMVSIETLDISNTNLGSKKLELLTSDLTLPNLRILKISTPKHMDINERSLITLQFNSRKMEQVMIFDDSEVLDVRTLRSCLLRTFNFSPFAYCEWIGTSRFEESQVTGC